MPFWQMLWGRLHYTWQGGRSLPFCFLDGTGCDISDWRGVIAGLLGDVSVLCVDFRGHGESDVPPLGMTLEDLAEDVLVLAAHLALPRILVVGHSLGGMVGLAAARRSAAVAGLVLLEGWTSLAAVRAAFPPGRFYGTLSLPDAAHIQAKDSVTRARFAPQAWARFWASVAAFAASDWLARATIPIMEVYGEMGRGAQTERRLGVPSNPHIRWRWVAGAGHYLPHECPVKVAAICHEALARLERQAG